MRDTNEVPGTGRHNNTVRRFTCYHGAGRWWFRINGWGIRYKDTRRHLPNYDERIRQVHNLKIGRHWFKLLRPR